MNLVGEAGYKLTFTEDVDTAVLTIEIRNVANTTLLDTVIIEKSKLRALIASLSEVAKDVSPDTDPVRQKYKLIFRKNIQSADVEFYP